MSCTCIQYRRVAVWLATGWSVRTLPHTTILSTIEKLLRFIHHRCFYPHYPDPLIFNLWSWRCSHSTLTQSQHSPLLRDFRYRSHCCPLFYVGSPSVRRRPLCNSSEPSRTTRWNSHGYDSVLVQDHYSVNLFYPLCLISACIFSRCWYCRAQPHQKYPVCSITWSAFTMHIYWYRYTFEEIEKKTFFIALTTCLKRLLYRSTIVVLRRDGRHRRRLLYFNSITAKWHRSGRRQTRKSYSRSDHLLQPHIVSVSTELATEMELGAGAIFFLNQKTSLNRTVRNTALSRQANKRIHECTIEWCCRCWCSKRWLNFCAGWSLSLAVFRPSTLYF